MLSHQRFRGAINTACRDVPLLYALYVFCIPLAQVLAWLRLTPTMITHLSNLCALTSVLALIRSDSLWLFPTLWLLALCFDVADGLVARVTKASSAQGSFYDHYSDQLKVVLLFLGVGIKYNCFEVWIVSYAVSTIFLMIGLTNYMHALRASFLGKAKILAPGKGEAQSESPQGSPVFRLVEAALSSIPWAKKWVWGILHSIFAMYGNAMLFLIPLGWGKHWALATMAVFTVIALRSLLSLLLALVQVNRELTVLQAPWK